VLTTRLNVARCAIGDSGQDQRLIKALPQFAKSSRATKPYLGIGDPLLDGPQDDPQWGAYYKQQAQRARDKQHCPEGASQRPAAAVARPLTTFASLFRGAQTDIEEVRKWAPLPETTDEVCAVGRRLGVPDVEILLGANATETRLKELSEQGLRRRHWPAGDCRWNLAKSALMASISSTIGWGPGRDLKEAPRDRSPDHYRPTRDGARRRPGDCRHRACRRRGSPGTWRDDLMNPVERLNRAARCSATAKRSRQPCRAPAVTGWTVCRFHGARGGGPAGSANGNYRHGGDTAEVLAARRAVGALLRRCRSTLKGG
jgi:hypothetical protein